METNNENDMGEILIEKTRLKEEKEGSIKNRTSLDDGSELNY